MDPKPIAVPAPGIAFIRGRARARGGASASTGRRGAEQEKSDHGGGGAVGHGRAGLDVEEVEMQAPEMQHPPDPGMEERLPRAEARQAARAPAPAIVR